jgi:hypothetical protein
VYNAIFNSLLNSLISLLNALLTAQLVATLYLLTPSTALIDTRPSTRLSALLDVMLKYAVKMRC